MALIGIDLGGTKIAAGITDDRGRILAKASLPTLAQRPYQEVVRDMATCSLTALGQSGLSLDDIRAIGIGIPGIGDNSTGQVVFCTNLGWHDVPLRSALQQYIKKPVYLENDATVAGLAEHVSGVSQGSSSSVFITLGTGLGGGIVLGGRPWTGAHGVASELGHLTMVVDGVACTCGKKGCIERYCSATALIRLAREASTMQPDNAMMLAVNGDMDRFDAKLVVDCAKAGDEVAMEVFQEYTRYLAIAINSFISFIDPEVIVLGGGVSKAGDFLLDAVREKIPKFLMFKTMRYGRVELARLGNDAGIIGAAMLGAIIEGGDLP